MKRLTIAIILTASLSFTADLHAQGAPPSTAFNWLNLNRRGASPATNYYGIVRPNNMTQNALMNLNQDFNNLRQSAFSPRNQQDGETQATGHAATFMNYGHYYPGLNRSGGGPMRPGQGAQGGPPRR